MKKVLILSITVLFAAGIASAAMNVGPIPFPQLPADSSSAPDAYGYTWVDNDNGGSPVYNWVDITSIGVQVLGLGDDNNVGPFQIGFQFPYYWYTVDHMWIGSNAYISFSSNANFAHPFANIPYNGNPNDLVAVLTGDLDFSRGIGTCYYYSNNVDSFVVSWINVREFGYDSTHTCQLILSARDSSLTFQYGENHGNFLDSNGQNMDVIGIENANGQVGLQYLRNNLPDVHLWHDGLAIKFHATPDPNYVVHDIGVVDGFHDGSGAPYVPVDQAYALRVLIKNFGNRAESTMTTKYIVRRGLAIVDSQTVAVGRLDPSEQVWIEYPRQTTPDRDTTYRVAFSSILPPDQNSNNNSKNCELDSYQLPQEIRYCDSTAEASRAWTGDFSGFGVEFEMPEAVAITTGSFYVNSVTASGPAYVYILAEDSTGNPSDLSHALAGDTITVSLSGWKTVDFTAFGLNFPANERFWIVALHAYMNTFDFGMDQTVPLSYRGWEYTGGMAPDRDRSVSDIMMMVYAEAGSGVEEEITPKSFSLSQNYPNPFNARTNIRFSLLNASDVKINIYNVAGQLVETISGHYNAGANVVAWDASHVSSGVYFYSINIDGTTRVKKMMLLK